MRILLAIGLSSIWLLSEAVERPHGWQFIGEFEGGAVQYIDMDTLKKERGYIHVRTLVDYKKPVWSVTSKSVRSEIDAQYIDCSRKRFVVLETASYECHMAKCKPVDSYRYPFEESEFKPIRTESSHIGNIFSLVCQQ